MSNVAYNYDPQNVSVILGGKIVEGLDEGQFVSAEFSEDLFTYKKGLQDGTRVRNPNRHGMITITLMQSSPSNKDFENYMAKGRSGDTGSDFSIQIVNNDGLEIVLADVCWFKKEPNLSFSKDVETRAWVAETGNLSISYNNDYKVLES